MIYKTLKKVSDVCQVLDKSKYQATLTTNGITFANNGDGSVTVNGTSTNEIYYVIKSLGDSLYLSHKYLLTGENSGLYLFVENRAENNAILVKFEHNKIASLPSNTKRSNCLCYIKKGTVCDNLILKPQLFDLTEMYGAGNEPTTVEQFRQDFPEELYDYKPYCFVKSYKTLLKASNVCQLLDKRKYPATKTTNGIIFTNNGDGSITVNGTASGVAEYLLYNTFQFYFSVIKNHKYLLIITDIDHNFNFVFGGSASGLGYYEGTYKYIIITASDTMVGKCYAMIRVSKEVTCNNETVKPQLFDLTEMYGAGNEPTTVEEFREKFPNELYDYKPYSIITSYKKSFKVTNSIFL